jgi:uncharacterized protein YuzE
LTALAEFKVTYDRKADAAYIYFVDMGARPKSAHMYACDPVEVGGMINLDFDEDGRFVGIEVLAASSKLDSRVLDRAEQI